MSTSPFPVPLVFCNPQIKIQIFIIISDPLKSFLGVLWSLNRSWSVPRFGDIVLVTVKLNVLIIITNTITIHIDLESPLKSERTRLYFLGESVYRSVITVKKYYITKFK